MYMPPNTNGNPSNSIQFTPPNLTTNAANPPSVNFSLGGVLAPPAASIDLSGPLLTNTMLAQRALDLLLRVARGYDWTADEIDQLQADFRAAGVDWDGRT